MFSFFNKSNYTVQIFTIIICGIVLWMPGFLNPIEIQLNSSLTPLYNKLVDTISVWSLLPAFLGLFCLYFIAFLLNNTLSENDIIPSNNYLLALFVVFLGSWHYDLLTFHHALPAALCLVFVIRNAFKVATHEVSYNNAFLTGFNIALASMFYFPAVIFVALIPIGLIVIRVFKLRFWLLAIAGFLFVYLCLAVWKFWFEILPSSVYDYFYFFQNLSLIELQLNKSLFFYILGIPFLLLILISIFKIITSLIEQNIAVRQAMLWLVWFAVIAAIGFFIDTKDFVIHSVILMLAVSLFFAKFITNIKRKFYAEIVFVIILAFVVFFRFYV